ncbi:adenine phosphoribosyltransferase [Leeuwenhoekiella sp. MAR_2009_132]|uniref:adenine phosphoribosyltransferase n=1 Tax=Leeuwenhoekiella sp. MAR_2009_132 TaxID=1392489 RepID=UPI00048F6ADA|nr:adenine phosphoribosyltransferase [Leeuwenhoekiella sp. MAR_2009_132]
MNLKNYITDVPNFPKEGITFKDISPLLANPEATNKAVELLAKGLYGFDATKIVGIESRGFLLGILLAQKLKLGFVPIRKPGKLPGAIISQSYALEYGEDSIEIQENSIKPGDLVIVHDDVLATGGTAAAACKLVEKCEGTVVQCNFLMELNFLEGRSKISNYPLHSIVHY